ncbi:MAG: oligosaccharide flippase family protein [Geminicoccaceae bacterium]|nr:oligosaccharide flippase family protein [Geminicoccaceae bacterium]
MSTPDGKLARSVAWAGLESGLSLAISVGSVVIVARFLGASEFGLGALAHGLLQIPLVLVGSLVHDALVQRPDLSAGHLRAARSGSLWAGGVLLVIVVASAPLLAAFFEEPRLALLIAALAPLLLFEAVSAPLLGLRRRALDFGSVARRLLAGRGLGALAGILAAAAGARAWAVVVQQLVAAATIAALSLRDAPTGPRARFERDAFAELVRFCRPIVAVQLLIQGSERLFLAYVGHQLGMAAAGYWSLAVRLVENVASVVATALYHVGLAFMSRLQQDRAALALRLEEAVRHLMLVTVPAVAALLVGADLLILLAVGPGWLAAALPVQILALGAMLLLRRLLPTVALTAAGRPRANLDAYLAENATTLPLLFLLGPLALPTVAALRAGRSALGWAVVTAAAARGLDRPLRRELGGLAVDLAGLGLGLAAGTAVRLALEARFQEPLVVLLGAAPTAALVAAGVILVLRPALARSLAGQVRALFGRPAGAAEAVRAVGRGR